MMRHKALIGLAGSSILLVGLALGLLLSSGMPARASAVSSPSAGTPTAETYCQAYEQALASRLGVSVSKLEAANEYAMVTTIHKAYSAGSITLSQEKSLLQKASKLATHPCAVISSAQGKYHHMNQQQFAAAHQAALTAVAGALGLPTATLESDLSSGQTVAQIAAAQHVSLDTVNTAYLTAVQDQLKTMVTNGSITKDQANAIDSNIKDAVAHGKYPLLSPHW
jgi:hypothetical protein